MDPIDDDEILEAIRKRRMANEIRSDVIEELKGRAERNVPIAVFNFVAAFGFWMVRLWIGKLQATSDFQMPLWNEAIFTLVPIVFVWNGYRSLVPHPRDRFLLLLAKEALLKGDEKPDSGVITPLDTPKE